MNVLIVEDDYEVRTKLIQAFKQLGVSAVGVTSSIGELCEILNKDIEVIERPVHKITMPKGYREPILSDRTNEREYGWYHKFNKPNGKRNLKR